MKIRKMENIQFLFFDSDKGFSYVFENIHVMLFPIKVKREEVLLIWHMVEFGLIVSYER